VEELFGKTAVVTGAGSGIGRALARRWAKAGMRVVLADIDEATLADTTSELTAGGADVLAVACDVSVLGAVEALRDRALERFERVNVVCNNAGVGSHGALISSTPIEDWQWVLGVNLWGVVHGTITFLPHLQEHGDGHIVNTASVVALMPTPGTGAYNASKFAVLALSETLYKELAMNGSTVGVSVLCPGLTATNLMDNEHHRPARFSAGAGVWSAVDDKLNGRLHRALKTGADPQLVADQVHDAVIAGDQFYIFTDDVFDGAIHARLDTIRSRANPPL
jgi:NAD(P)-dependent dehydrogenase (short-subunit alcohol dehydrogenase family)